LQEEKEKNDEESLEVARRVKVEMKQGKTEEREIPCPVCDNECFYCIAHSEAA
jgi:hypothetical protein